MRFHLYIFLFLFSPLLGAAQQSYTRIITTNDGLPSNNINCLYQDSVGRLWIGTDAGIGVYDGLNFAIVTSKDGLASNDVRSITQDNQGVFWFACYDGGVTKFDGKVFTRLTVRDGLRSGNIRRVFYSKTFKTLFLGADEGFYTYHNGKLVFYGKANGKLREEHEITGFLEGNGFVYAFPFNDYRLKFYPTTGLIIQDKDTTPEKSPSFWITSAIVTSKHDTVWGNHFSVLSKSGLKSYSTAYSGLVFDLTEDVKGNVWVPVWSSMDKGIFKYDGNGFIDYSTRFGIEKVGCIAVLSDRFSNILWIGTDDKGLVAVPQEVFSYYPTKAITGSKDFVKLFRYKSVLHFLMKDRIIRFRSEGHSEMIPISILEKSGAADLIRKIKRDREQHLPITNGELWRLPEFYDVTTDPEGNLWVSSTVGFYRLSSDLKSITKVLPLNIRYGHIAFNNQGTLYNWGNWLSNLDVIPDPASKVSSDKMQRYSKENATLPKDITQIVPIGSRMLFSSLHGGLYLFDGKSFTHLNKSSPMLPDNISDVCLDQKGNVVYCTNTGEIGVGSFEGGRFVLHHQFDSLDQSFGRNFGWVISDKHYNIYVGTNRGMLVIHYPEVFSSLATSVRFYSVSEGYRDFSMESPVIDEDGILWLGSQENLLRIDTKAFSDQSHTIQKVVLSSFVATLTNYNFLNDFDLHEKKRSIAYWRIPYKFNSLTFQFNCINLLNPEKDRFSIKLEGFDNDFRDVGGDRKAGYTNLPAGKYRFIVKVNNLNTLQKQETVLLEFTISPPYWQTWWFYVLLTAGLIALVVVLSYVREKRIRKKAQTDLQIAELEMQALQAQMNPHFVFNVINSIQRYILERDAKKGTQLLGDFSRMIRLTFSLSSKRIITLQDEIAYLVSYLKLEQERMAYKFQFEIETEKELNPAEIHIPSMLIQPIVENAVKHGLSPLEGSDGHLTIRFAKIDDHSLRCVVEDNGIGIDQSLAVKRDSTTRLSKALNITQRRIELFRQSSRGLSYSIKIEDRSKLNTDLSGTIVMIEIPVQ